MDGDRTAPGLAAAARRPARAPTWRQRTAPHVLAGLGYAVAALALTYPLACTAPGVQLGNDPDRWIYQWNTYWVAAALRDGLDPFHTRLLYHPAGTSLVFHTLLLPANALAPLLLPVLGVAGFVKLLPLLGLWSSAVAAHALAFTVTRSWSAAVPAALVFAFAPHQLDQARGHLASLFGVWLALMAFAFVRLLRARTWRGRAAAATATAAAAVLALLTKEAYGVAGAYLLAVLALARPIGGARLGAGGALAWLAGAGAVATLFAMPYLSRAWREWPPAPPHSGSLSRSWHAASVAAEDFVTAPAGSTLWGGRAASAPPDARPRAGNVAFVGYGVLLLALWSAVAAWRDRVWRWWMGLALFFAVAAMGPVLRIGGHDSTLPALFNLAPLLDLTRAPNRYLPAAMLCLSVALAAAWARRITPPGADQRPGLTLAAALAIALDLAMVPLPTTPAPVSPFYARLAADPLAGALIEVPSHRGLYDKYYLFLQTLHGRPLHAGHTSRLHPGARDLIESVPLLAALQRAGTTGTAAVPASLPDDLAALRELGFAYIVFHQTFADPALPPPPPVQHVIEAAVAARLGPPAYADRWLHAYALGPPAAAPR